MRCQSATNYVDAIFTIDTVINQYNILAYSYNASPTSDVYETLKLVKRIYVPSGTNIKYRSAVYDKEAGTLPWNEWQKTKNRRTSF